MSHPSSMIMTRIGEREYPLRAVGNCKTCQSDYREEAENLLLTAGRGFTAIARALPEDANLSAQNLSDHYNNGHMPLQVETVIRLRERRAKEVGKKIEEAAELLVDQVVLADLVIQRTYERLTAGEIEPDVSDGIAAARFKQQVERELGESVDNEMWVSVVNAMISDAEAILPPDEFQAWGERLARNPVLHAMRRKQQEQSQEQMRILEQ